MAKKVIGLELGERAVRAVAVTGGRGGRAAVTRAETFQLPAGDLPTKLAAATGWLKQFLAGEAAGLIVAAVPSSAGVTKILELPPATGSTLEELVRFEAEHNLPFATAECCSDFAALRNTSDATMILLVSARRAVVQQVAAWIKDAGGKARRVTVGAPARMTLPLVQNNPGAAKNEVTAVLDLDTDSAEILIIENGSLRSTRSVSLNGSDDALRAAAVEARRTVQAYRATRRGATLGRVLLGGAAATATNATTVIEAELLAPVSRLDPWVGMLLSGPAAQLPTIERGAYAGATGLALQGAGRGLQLNLIPEDERAGLSPAVKQGLLRSAAGLVLVLSGLVWLATNPLSPLSNANLVQMALVSAQAELSAAIKGPGGTTATKAAALGVLKEEIRRDSMMWLEVLRQLSERLPGDIVLTELAMEKGQQVVLRGSAKNHGIVAEALGVVRNMPMFLDARIAYSTTTLVANEPRSEFEIMATLEPLAAKAGRRR